MAIRDIFADDRRRSMKSGAALDYSGKSSSNLPTS
jgi:hypothetical protein